MAITGDDVTLDEIIPISYDFSVVEGTTELFSQVSMLLWSIIMVLSDISTVSSPDELAVVGECLFSSLQLVFAASQYQRYSISGLV